MKPKNYWQTHKIPVPKNHHNFKTPKKIRRSKGFWTEEKFFRAIENANGSAPSWFKAVLKTSKEDDRKGIDFIIQTYSGDILLIQIKSSEAGANVFKRKKRNLRIIVLVIKDNYNEEKIRILSFSAMQAEINRLKRPFR